MAFFTRSSAANIPVNMNLCRKLNLPEDTFGVSIPLGSTINMAGAAVTITVLTLSACHTLGIEVHFITAVLLSLLASVCACGTAGVPGGSLMLIPLACSLFGIDSAVSMQVVAVGFIISVLQDSCRQGSIRRPTCSLRRRPVSGPNAWRQRLRRNIVVLTMIEGKGHCNVA